MKCKAGFQSHVICNCGAPAPGVYTPSQVEGREELVEVVARAIADETCIPWEHTPEENNGIDILAPRTLYRKCATAAINAIREWEGR